MNCLSLRVILESIDDDGMIRKVIESFAFPLIHGFMVRRNQLKACNHMSNEFANILNKNGIKAKPRDSGKHVVTLVWIKGECWMVDLTAAQFMCNIDDYDELNNMVDQVAANPWKTIQYERLPQLDGEMNNEIKFS